jgi:hypothetical protein
MVGHPPFKMGDFGLEVAHSEGLGGSIWWVRWLDLKGEVACLG